MSANLQTLPPHILVYPLPFQGHVNSMINLAEILLLSGLHVTLILSDYNHDRLLRHGTLLSHFSRYPGFRVATIPDGLPPDHPRSGDRTIEAVLKHREVAGPHFRHLMESTDALSDGGARRRVSCLILDGSLRFARSEIELGIPYFYVITVSACAFWPIFCAQQIVNAVDISLKAKDESKLEYWKKKEMDLLVTSVPGMETILRRRDLPGYFRVEDINEIRFGAVITEIKRMGEGEGLILNTFEDLEGPILDQIRKHIPNVYSLGPLRAHLKARLEEKGMEVVHYSSSFWEEDRSSITWLDSQPHSSVIYVSFGSIVTLTRDELMEFWYGLVNSGHRFLWVIRPDSIIGNDDGNKIPVELEEGTKSRGLMVEWVPQHEVLAHPATAAFFTHSGWNSILECIAVGLPMLCWSYIADQMTNSRFVSEVWRIGLDMKDTCDRVLIEKMIRDVMEVKRGELLERARVLAGLAKKSVSEGGSSYLNLNRLIEFLKSTVA